MSPRPGDTVTVHPLVGPSVRTVVIDTATENGRPVIDYIDPRDGATRWAYVTQVEPTGSNEKERAA